MVKAFKRHKQKYALFSLFGPPGIYVHLGSLRICNACGPINEYLLFLTPTITVQKRLMVASCTYEHAWLVCMAVSSTGKGKCPPPLVAPFPPAASRDVRRLGFCSRGLGFRKASAESKSASVENVLFSDSEHHPDIVVASRRFWRV